MMYACYRYSDGTTEDAQGPLCFARGVYEENLAVNHSAEDLR